VSSRLNTTTVVTLVVFTLIASALLYSAVGDREMASMDDELASAGASLAAARESSVDPSNGKAAPIGDLVSGLERRLAENPDDGKGWLLLAKSYDHLGDPIRAASAYSRARELGFVDAALERLPATNAMQPQSSAIVRGRVSVTADASGSYEPSDTVFIVAKPAGSGPAIPLAVIRRTASDLPFDFILSDKESMVAGNSLSGASNIVVVAKISETGDAMSVRSGLKITSQIFSPQDAPFLNLELGTAGSSSVRPNNEKIEQRE
jgi:hypothetical protein